MKHLILLSLFLLSMGCCHAQEDSTVIKVAVATDTLQPIASGFYHVIMDESKTGGFRLINTGDYYYVAVDDIVSIKDIDSVYKRFEKGFNHYVLDLKFNSKGTEDLFIFSKKYLGMKTGLLLDNQLICTPVLNETIDGGILSLAGNFSEKELDNIIMKIKKISSNKAP